MRGRGKVGLLTGLAQGVKTAYNAPTIGTITERLRMSGRNQHHFWQLLQRGFGVERKPGYTTVYAYSKDRNPYPVSTRNYGAERDFFDFAPGEGADAQVSQTENELQGLVRHLRTGGEITRVHSEQLAKLIEHLETRTKFLRENLFGSVVDVTDGLQEWFSDSGTHIRMLKKYASQNLGRIEKALEGEISDPATRQALATFFVDNLDKMDLSEYLRTSAAAMDGFLRDLVGKLGGTIKEAHIELMLGKNLNSSRVRRYNRLHYRIATGFEGQLICPDTMVAFITDSKPTPFLDKSDRLEAVWVPLTADLMLIGENGARVDRTTKTVQRILASTAYNGFIALSDSPRLRLLSSRIGTNAEVISKNEMKALKRKSLASFLDD